MEAGAELSWFSTGHVNAENRIFSEKFTILHFSARSTTTAVYLYLFFYDKENKTSAVSEQEATP